MDGPGPPCDQLGFLQASITGGFHGQFCPQQLCASEDIGLIAPKHQVWRWDRHRGHY